jgi:hypothetical protein
MTKRIKITDPKDLKEGMRVEVEYRNEMINVGKAYKASLRPSCEKMLLDYGADSVLVDIYGNFEKRVKSIHRLIDGIEDVVVGDVLTLLSCDMRFYVTVLDRQGDLIDISDNNSNIDNVNSLKWFTRARIKDLKNYEIYVPKDKQEPKKIEVTLEEAKQIIAKEKGVDVNNITIKDEQ